MSANEPSGNDPLGNEFFIGDSSAPVPVFSCIVYLSSSSGPGVRARVANLEGLECRAATEREALNRIVQAFKRRVSELIQGETPIPWIEPVAEPEPDEQKRFIPVHL